MKVLLCSWSSADWPLLQPLIDADQLPVLGRLIEEGSSGPLRVTWPLLEATLATTAITGRTPDIHGILTDSEIDAVSGARVPPLASSRQVPALWDWLEQAELRSHVIHWPATHPVKGGQGVRVSDRFARGTTRYGSPWPIVPGSMAPHDAEVELLPLRLHPGDLTDEALLPFVPRLAEINQETDRRLVPLAAALAETVTIHAAATWSLEHRPWDFAAVHYPLLGMLRRFVTYQDPLFERVLPESLRFLDAMLGRLLRLAGDDTLVVLLSPHGWKASHGLVLLHGPGVPRDELTHGARIIDIAPTVLAACGIAKPEELPGRDLLHGFAERAALCVEEPPVASQKVALANAAEIGDAAEWLEKLGYRDTLAAPVAAAAASIEADRAFHLAVYRMGTRDKAQAIPELERCAGDKPLARLLLAHAYLDNGRLDDCERTLRTVTEPAHRAGAMLLEGQLLLRRGRKQEALALLEDVGEVTSPLVSASMLAWLRGEVYRSLGRLIEAEACYRQTIEGDPYMAPAHVALAAICLRQNRIHEAAEASLAATGIDYAHAEAHFLLAYACARLGDWKTAGVAAKTCLQLSDDHRQARALLAIIERRGAA